MDYFQWLAKRMEEKCFIGTMTIAQAIRTTCNEMLFDKGNRCKVPMVQEFIRMVKEVEGYNDKLKCHCSGKLNYLY